MPPFFYPTPVPSPNAKLRLDAILQFLFEFIIVLQRGVGLAISFYPYGRE